MILLSKTVNVNNRSIHPYGLLIKDILELEFIQQQIYRPKGVELRNGLESKADVSKADYVYSICCNIH